MHMVVAFTPDYGSAASPELGDAFWLVESPANRAIAELRWKAKATDPNSAIFKPGDLQTEPADIEGMFETVELHHPTWSQIDFVGVPLPPEVERIFRDEGFQISRKGSTFTLHRSAA